MVQGRRLLCPLACKRNLTSRTFFLHTLQGLAAKEVRVNNQPMRCSVGFDALINFPETETGPQFTGWSQPAIEYHRALHTYSCRGDPARFIQMAYHNS